jgi:hypothetical protein
MTELVYEEIKPITKSEVEAALITGDSDNIIIAMLGAAYYIDEWRWVQNHCLGLLGNADTNLRNIAVVCLGHIARIHGTLDKEKVLAALEKLRNDPQIGEEVSNSLEEIEWYLSHPED